MFFKDLSIYLKALHRDGGRERNLPSTGSNSHNSWDWVMMKSGTLSSIQVFCVDGRKSSLSVASRCSSRKLDQELRWNLISGSLISYVDIQSSGLTFCVLTPASQYVFLVAVRLPLLPIDCSEICLVSKCCSFCCLTTLWSDNTLCDV